MATTPTLTRLTPVLARLSRRFWPYVGKRRWLAGAAFTALFIEVAMRVLEPWPLKFIFDRLIPVGAVENSSGAAWIASLSAGALLALVAGAIVLIASLRALAAYAGTVGFALVGNRVLTEVRNDLYRHLQALPLSFHHKARTGDLVVRVIGDIGLLQEVAVTAMLPLLGNLLILVGIFSVMLWVNWQLALIALSLAPLLWLLSTRTGRRIIAVSRNQRMREGAMAATTAESMGAIKTVQALALTEFFNRLFSSASAKSLKEGVKAKRLSANLERTVDVLIGIATAAVLWRGTQLVMLQVITPGDLIVFLAYLKIAYKPVRNFAKYTGRLAKAAAAGERVLELLEHARGVHDRPDAIPAPVLNGAVSFEEISFAYEPNKLALRDINFEIAAGEHIAIVGASGAGKSTVANLILRLYEPNHGRLLIDGTPIDRYTLDSLRSQISVVLQDGLLFATTVRDNIAANLPDIDDEAIIDAARLANADDFISRLPDGYDTVLGERGVTLSNGQRQRIAIARAAIRKTPIFILDEPTAGLDEENERQVIDALDRLTQGRTTVLITHNLGLAARADRVLYLDRGRVLDLGRHRELMQRCPGYAQLFDARAQDEFYERPFNPYAHAG